MGGKRNARKSATDKTELVNTNSTLASELNNEKLSKNVYL
jgi:hypothetical protein